MVVEWIPSLWKNSFTLSATVMYWARFRHRTWGNMTVTREYNVNMCVCTVDVPVDVFRHVDVQCAICLCV